jgi:hypothetical protein
MVDSYFAHVWLIGVAAKIRKRTQPRTGEKPPYDELMAVRAERAPIQDCNQQDLCTWKDRPQFMDDTSKRIALSKVPEVTLTFWIIKIAATTLGEIGGDSVTMTLNWGYLAGTILFLSLLIVLVAAQILAKRFHPFLYWVSLTLTGGTMLHRSNSSIDARFSMRSSPHLPTPDSASYAHKWHRARNKHPRSEQAPM